LHLQASAWYEREGFVAEAMSHALAASAHERAAVLVERYALNLLYHGEIPLIRSWLEALPEDLIHSRPFLCLAYACSALFGMPSAVELAGRWLRDTRAALGAALRDENLDESARAACDLVTTYIPMIEAYLAFERGNAPEEAIRLALQALERLPADNLRLRGAFANVIAQAHLQLGNLDAAERAFAEARQFGEASDGPYLALAATYAQAHVARERGQLHRAAALCRDVLRSIAEPAEWAGRPLPVAGAVSIVLGSILLEWNDLEEAARALTKGLEQARLTDFLPGLVEGYTWLIRLRRAQGDAAGAFDLIEQAKQIWPFFAEYFDAQRARLWLAQAESESGRLAEAARWALERRVTLEDEQKIPSILPLFGRDLARLTLARLLVAQRRQALLASRPPDLQRLLEFLEGRHHLADEEGWTGRALEILLVQALALQVQGDAARAVAALERARALAEPEGYVRLFVDEGAPLARLLYQAAERGIAPTYAGRLLAAFRAEGQGGRGAREREVSPAPLLPSTSALIEPLSEREIEVLQLLAEGLTSREIARKLVISAGTVTVHTNSIYGKLGAHNRTQAVAIARALGILSSS
jgi:LuxR family maltose regulon positive regulatory protein